MPRSPSYSRSRSPVKRRRSNASVEPDNGCPFLIRLFITKGRHTPMIEFEEARFPIQDEFTAYGWKTSTPSSLIQLLLPSFPAPYRSPLARYSFRHIYVDASPRGLYRTKDLVSFTGRDLMESALSIKKSKEKSGMDMDVELDNTEYTGLSRKIEEKTLEDYGFVTGDLISVALHIPEARNYIRRPNGPGLGGPPGGERGGFGRGNNGGGGGGSGFGAGAPGPGGQGVERPAGPWQRGGALPDQGALRGGQGRPSFGAGGGEGREGRETGPPGGRWGRGGGNVGAGVGAGQATRGSGRRSRSPDYGAGARDDKVSRGGRRSASPEARRESWASRKRDD